MTGTVLPVEGQVRKQFDQAIFDHVCFMAVAARGCVDEPHLYGPLRLLDTVSRLVELLEAHGLSNPFLAELQGHIDANKFKVMTDQKGFLRLIDEVVMLCAREEVQGGDRRGAAS